MDPCIASRSPLQNQARFLQFVKYYLWLFRAHRLKRMAFYMQISIVEERPDSPSASPLLSELDKALWQHPYPPESRHAFTIDKLLRENVAFFVARVGDNPAACSGLKLFPNEYGEVKRMYVRPVYRGRGLAKELLSHLANYARERKVHVLRLETGIYQLEAIGLYERWGFLRRPPFGEYREDPLSVYFERVLG